MDRQLPDGSVLLETYGARAFCADACARFPELAGALRGVPEAIHLQMSVLGQTVRAALGRGDAASAERVCAFVEKALAQPRAESELANAVCVSFVEREEFLASATGQEVWNRLGPLVKRTLDEQAERSLHDES